MCKENEKLEEIEKTTEKNKEKGAYNYCKLCGRILAPTYEREHCPGCEENLLFDKVRDFIRSNDVTEMQVAEYFDIPQKKVKDWIKEGRIEYKEDGDIKALANIRCERCGALVSFGTLCSKCLKIMNNSRQGYAGEVEHDNKMRFLDN